MAIIVGATFQQLLHGCAVGPQYTRRISLGEIRLRHPPDVSEAVRRAIASHRHPRCGCRKTRWIKAHELLAQPKICLRRGNEVQERLEVKQRLDGPSRCPSIPELYYD